MVLFVVRKDLNVSCKIRIVFLSNSLITIENIIDLYIEIFSVTCCTMAGLKGTVTRKSFRRWRDGRKIDHSQKYICTYIYIFGILFL